MNRAKKRPTVDVVIVQIGGGRVYARRLSDNRTAMVGTFEEFDGSLEEGDVLSIPDDIAERDWR